MFKMNSLNRINASSLDTSSESKPSTTPFRMMKVRGRGIIHDPDNVITASSSSNTTNKQNNVQTHKPIPSTTNRMSASLNDLRVFDKVKKNRKASRRKVTSSMIDLNYNGQQSYFLFQKNPRVGDKARMANLMFKISRGFRSNSKTGTISS